MASVNRDIATILGRTEASNTSNAALGTGSGGGGATSYANAAALPTSGNTVGDLAFTLDKKALYNWDGAEWDRIFSGPNETLTWDSALSSTYTLSGTNRKDVGLSDSAKTVLEFSASEDFEGFPVTYSYQMIPPYPLQLDSAYGDDSASGGKGLIDSSDHPTRPRITLMPSFRDSDEGSFIFRVKATDGTHVITSSSTIALEFGAPFIFSSSVSGFAATTTDEYNYQHPTGGNQSGSGAALSNSLTLGKIYFEVLIDTFGTYLMMGIAGGSLTTQANTGWNTSNSIHIYEQSGGAVYGPGMSGTMPGGVPTNGSVLGFAFDTTAGKVWLRDGSGWYSGTGDPSAPGGGCQLTNGGGGAWSAGDPMYLSFCTGSGTPAAIGTIKRKAADLTYTVPSGFSLN